MGLTKLIQDTLYLSINRSFFNAPRLSLFGSTYGRWLVHEGFELALERLDVFELAIDRGEADVGHLVEILEPRHDDGPDVLARDLFGALALDVALNAVDERAKSRIRHRTLLERFLESALELIAAVRLPLSVALHDDEIQKQDFLHGGKAKSALVALAAAADGFPFRAHARINDAGVRMAADGTEHKNRARGAGHGAR